MFITVTRTMYCKTNKHIRNIHKDPRQWNILYLPLIKSHKQICHLFTRMLNLQKTIRWKIQNTASQKVKQSEERYQGTKPNTTLQTFQLTQLWFQYARKIHSYRPIDKHYLIAHRQSQGKSKTKRNFWIEKLRTLAPYDLNQELN